MNSAFVWMLCLIQQPDPLVETSDRSATRVAPAVVSSLESKVVNNGSIPRPRPVMETCPNYRVQIRTNGGRRFSGVVTRDWRFHRHVFAGEHHKKAIYQSPESFTLRFVDGLDGLVALRWNQIARLEVREVLDLAGLKAMERAQYAARVTRRQSSQRLREQEEAEKNADQVEPVAEGPESKSASPSTKPSSTPAAARTLIDEFPPADGWTPDHKKHLEWRRTVMGVFPDEEEQRFLDNYTEWLPAYEEWVAAEEAKKAEEEKKVAEAEEARKNMERRRHP